jgi:signal transduction histidine kinase
VSSLSPSRLAGEAPGPPGQSSSPAALGPLRILAVEDNPGDVRLLQRLLARAGLGAYEVAVAERIASALEHLGGGHGVDVVLLDLSLPDSLSDSGGDRLEGLARIRRQAPEVPILLLTGVEDEDLAVAAVREGAQDYMVKRQVDARLLGRAIRHAAERQRLKAELARQAAELRLLDRRKDEFLAMLAHELRNPLAAISNAIHALNLAVAADQGARLRGIVAHQVQHLGRMVDDLLDVSRLLRGKIVLRPERVDLRAVVEQALQSARATIEAPGHQLALALPAEPCSVEGDATRLEQVVSNLLHNAAKFTPPGGRIDLAVERADGWAVLKVRDTGEGIPPEMLSQVFEMFTQVQPSLDRARGGLGIGLTLVRSLVELHGGVAEAASGGPGLGSEFTVRLPLAAEARFAAVPATAPAAEPARERPMRVLVVEDNPHAAETLQELLSLWGHEVQVAHDGPAALAEAAGHPPEVVLLDLGLPGMSGFEVAAELRRLPGLAGIRIVACTGYGQQEDRQRTREASFDEHLVKPVAPELLRRVLAVPLPGGQGPTR